MMSNKCDHTHSMGKCILALKYTCKICINKYCQFHINDHRCIQNLVNELHDEEEHINIRNECNNSNNSNSNNVDNTNCYDIYDSDSDNENCVCALIFVMLIIVYYVYYLLS